MNKERILVLLLNAIDTLIDQDILNVDIKEELGATPEEWEELMSNF